MSYRLLIHLLTFSLIISCGKKAEESEKSKEDHLTYSEAEINFYSINEVQRCVETNDVKSLSQLLTKRKNLQLNNIGHDGETLLTRSLSKGYIQIARLLINAGADINVSNINNETALIVAVNKNLNKVVEELVEQGADLNKRDVFEDTALILAIKRKNEPLALFLIEKGANILLNDRYGRSPYNLAHLNDLLSVTDMLKTILEKRFGEPTIEEFQEQILNIEFKRIARTLSRFSHLVLQYEKINPLALLSHRTNEEEMIEGAKLFIRWGAKINGPINSQSNPPLIEAILNLRFQYVDFLLDNSANPNKVFEERFTPLYYAIELNEPTLVEKLLSKGALKRTVYFDACQTAKKIGDEMNGNADKVKNKQIKKILFCNFRSWL